LRWADSDFDLPPDLTRGKSSVTLKFEVVRGRDSGPYTDFHHRIYCYGRLESGIRRQKL
jgi:hypothetical protein